MDIEARERNVLTSLRAFNHLNSEASVLVFDDQVSQAIVG